MEFTGKIKKIGTSRFILIPSNIKNLMELSEGDIIKVDIVEIIKNVSNDDNFYSFRCLICGKTFSSNEVKPLCPNCNDKNVRRI